MTVFDAIAMPLSAGRSPVDADLAAGRGRSPPLPTTGDRHPRIVGHPATEDPGNVVIKQFTRDVAAVFPAGMSPIANGGIPPEVII